MLRNIEYKLFPDGDRVLRRREVEAKTGFKKSTLYALIKQGEFPQRISLGGRMVGWRASEVEEWIRSRPTTDARIAKERIQYPH